MLNLLSHLIDNQVIEIYTIGHGNRKIEDLILLLQRNKIEIVIDVRSIPYSRYHPQYRQLNFKSYLEYAGVQYLWLGRELGGRPSDKNLYVNGEVSYEAIKQTEFFANGIQQVLQLATANIKVTLICSESDQNECHRKHLIADELAKREINVLHINKAGVIEQHINLKS